MRKRPVANVVQKSRYLRCFIFFVINCHSFLTQAIQYPSHQMHGAQGMVESGVYGSGVNQVCKPKLLNAPESLKVGMLNQIKQELIGDRHKPINGIVNNFLFIQAGSQD